MKVSGRPGPEMKGRKLGLQEAVQVQPVRSFLENVGAQKRK